MPAKLNKLIAQKKSLEARIAKEKAKAKQQERKDDTRRKILVGAVVLKHMEHDVSFKHNIEHLLEAQLVKTVDRDLFGIAPKKEISITSDPAESTQSEFVNNIDQNITHQG